MVSAELPTVHALWVGPRLGPVAVACLRSFPRAGHRLVLHVYQRPDDLPADIEIADANRTIPEDRIVRHGRTGSLTLFADIFRYELLASGAEVYVDCDIYCVRPLHRADYIFGMEDDSGLNNAVLALPASSPMLEALRTASREPGFIPPWYSARRKLELRVRKGLGVPKKLADMRWGVIGPQAITHYAREFGVLKHASPPDVFYPLDLRRTSLLFDPHLKIADLVSSRTVCIHLYSEMIRRSGNRDIPPTSPLGRMLAGETLDSH